jgi:RNA recognition motif-containing protein
MKKMFIGNLPHDATEESVEELFSEYGTVRSIKLSADVFTGRCRGFGFIEMEGHEARAAIAGLNGKALGDRNLRVNFENPRAARGRVRR